MRQVATWIVAVGLATVLVGCGHDRAADGAPASAERAVRAILDALATGDAKPLCEAQDLREHYVAVPESVRATTSFEAFTDDFRAACARRAPNQRRLHQLAPPDRPAEEAHQRRTCRVRPTPHRAHKS